MELLLTIVIIGAILNAILANAKGRNALGWALLGGWFTPLSTLILALLPNLNEQRATHAALEEARRRAADADDARRKAEHEKRLAELRSAEAKDTKTCPQCAETIKAAAVVCRLCGHRFSPQP
jgi:hypothetical protein